MKGLLVSNPIMLLTSNKGKRYRHLYECAFLLAGLGDPGAPAS